MPIDIFVLQTNILKKIRDVTFVNARSVLGVIYNSKSGNTSLKWRQTQKYDGKVTGDATLFQIWQLLE